MLRALNTSDGGWATIRELSVSTDLHRTTIRRLLETLCSEGLVIRSKSDGSYRLTCEVKSLSDGFSDEEWISQIASPILGELLQTVSWPSDLTTLDGDAMVIRETTHRFSPLSFHRKMVRVRMPLLTTASGRAYLAFCPNEERQALLDKLERNDTLIPSRRTAVEHMLDEARKQGHASNVGEWATEPHIAAIAVPVFSGTAVGACLNIVMLKKSLSLQNACDRYLGVLQTAARKIEALMSEKKGRQGDRKSSSP